MKTSKLIFKLVDLLKKYGDLDVTYWDEESGEEFDLDDIELNFEKE
jgi:hypothetical protein